MNEITNYFGIDVSKEVFDVVDSFNIHYQFPNSIAGFKTFIKLLDSSSHCVMESTGYYHLLLANYLANNDILISVVNPLAVKRFVQMHLSRIKTDKSDALMIRQYSEHTKLRLWEAQSANKSSSLQLVSLIDQYTKQSTSLKNKLKGEEALGYPEKVVVSSLKRSLRSLQKEILALEERLLVLVKEDYQDLLTRIESITGLGRKTAVMLIIMTDGFKKFDKASQLCSFAGITPIIRESGSSIRSRARISKMGNRKLRQLLFMCSFSAKKHNKACRDIFERIVAKGKSKKLALIAVCNKLLKQAFAIAKSGLYYDNEYRSVLIKK